MFLNPWYANGAPPGSQKDAETRRHLAAIQKQLKQGWTVHINSDARLYYCNHATQTSSWLPPVENWDHEAGLPYGWETATDKEGKHYFINHLNKTTTYEDPRKDFPEEPPQPRHVELTRNPELGFGFVAGSEKPVIVRFVTEGGPSVEKLLPGDQILQINGEDVKKAPRDHVIQLVRSCKETVKLTVCQPPLDNSSRKSALLSAAKKAKLKSNPSRVRFAEGVVINGSPLFTPSNFSLGESCVPFLPNVLKVFLENGQTKSFKYDSSTAVQDVLESLQQKLGLKCLDHFSLVVEHIKSLRRNKLTLLDTREALARIAARPGAHNLRCLFRIAFVPRDAYELLRKDSVAFEYLYTQCCNDVVQERFAPELKYDIALRLAALHIQQHALSNNMQGKITIKAIEREFGLERFVPVSLVETMKRKELRKLLAHFLKLNQGLAAPGHKTLTALQAKLHYLRIIGELPSYGAKCFATNLRDSNMETVILISPRFGISQITGLRNSVPLNLCSIEHVTSIHVTREDELSHKVEIHLKEPDKEPLLLSLEDRDAEELVQVLQGYYKLIAGRILPVHREKDRWAEDSALPYHTKHRVQAAGWSYLDSTPLVDACNVSDDLFNTSRKDGFIDLAAIPPYHSPPEGFKIPNGHIPVSLEKSNEISVNSMATAITSSTYCVDKNMNKTMDGYPSLNQPDTHNINNNNNNYVESNITEDNRRTIDNSKSTSNTVNLDVQTSSQKLGFDMQSVVSMEILENSDTNFINNGNEEYSQQVIRRVHEMKQLVEDAEQYLTDREGDAETDQEANNDTESLRSGVSHTDSEMSVPYGQLKHSDSLLLLTQGQKQVNETTVTEAVKKIVLPDNEPSESDTDSMSTPTDSPSHRPSADRPRRPSVLKSSDSSFGLHSPDNFLAGFSQNQDVQELLRRLQAENILPYNFAEGTLYLDPDIIDLTMIPPPITPDDDRVRQFPIQLSTPPTPFADRLSLEFELQMQALGRRPQRFEGIGLDAISLAAILAAKRNAGMADLCRSNTSSTVTCEDTAMFSTGSDIDDSLSLSGCSASVTSEDSGFPLGEGLSTLPPLPGEGHDSNSDYPTWVDDIDSFIANVTVPPPPDRDETPFSPGSEKRGPLLDEEELAAYIIPPPPTSGSSEEEDSDVSQRNMEDDYRYEEQDRHVGELRVSWDQREKDKSISPKIASLQQRFATPMKNDDSNETTTSANGSKYESKKEEKDHPVSIAERRTLLQTAMGMRPQPSLPKQITLTPKNYPGSKSKVPSTGIPQRSPPSSTNTNQLLAKSSSQGDLGDGNYVQKQNYYTNTAVKSPVNAANSSNGTNYTLSASSEDVGGQWHLPCHSPSSPSKHSLAGTSSSDSLASVVTVRSAGHSNSEEDDRGTPSPPLPPRSSPAKRKPPLPPPTLQEESHYQQMIPSSPSLSRKTEFLNGSFLQSNVRYPTLPSRLKRPGPNGEPILNGIGGKASPATSPEKGSPHNRKPPHPPNFSPIGGTGKAPMPEPYHTNNGSLPRSASKLPRPQMINSPSKVNGIPCSQTWGPHKHTTNNKNNTSPPLKTSSPKIIRSNGHNATNGDSRTLVVNGKDNNLFLNDSLETSFERDSLDGTENTTKLFHTSEVALERVLMKLEDVVTLCLEAQTAGGGVYMNEDKFQISKDMLTCESRQFVTASKLFVKSATESDGGHQQMTDCLNHCILMLEQVSDITEDVANYTSTPSHTHNLVLKVKDVAETFMQTVQAAGQARAVGLTDSSMNTLMQRATVLAGTLTALMRALRVFAP